VRARGYVRRVTTCAGIPPGVQRGRPAVTVGTADVRAPEIRRGVAIVTARRSGRWSARARQGVNVARSPRP